MSRRRLALLLVFVGVVVLGVGCGERDEGDVAAEPDAAHLDAQPSPVPSAPPVPSHGLAGADVALDHLRQALADPEYTNLEILVTLAAVRQHYLSSAPPPGFPMTAPGDGEEGRGFVPTPDLDAHAKQRGWSAEYIEEVRAFRRDAEALYLQALTLERIEGEANRNTRFTVNARAAHALAATQNREVSERIIQALEQVIFKAEYEDSHYLYDCVFAALGQLGHPDALKWMIREFTHPLRVPRRRLFQAHAAHKAMLHFQVDEVDGSVRRRLVSEMIKTYWGPEMYAEQPEAWGWWAYWAWMGPDIVRATQHFAGNPTGEDGQPLNTMAQLEEWYRAHKNPSKPPWTDE